MSNLPVPRLAEKVSCYTRSMPRRLNQIIDLKNFLVVCGALFFVAFVGVIVPYFVYKHRAGNLNTQKAEQTSQSKVSNVLNVTYTNKGFEPKDFTVSVGTTVVWTNESDKQMWVASDPHPSHNALPGFDQQGPTGHEEHDEPESSLLQKLGLEGRTEAHGGGHAVYEYTFSKIGIWGYHNHLSPNDKGKVTVR